MPAAVSHGSLAVTISEKPQVSQPAPFSDGQTVVVPRSQIEVTQEGAGHMFVFDTGVNLDDLVKAVNQVGAARSEEHTSELQSLMRISYAVFCLKKKKKVERDTI